MRTNSIEGAALQGKSPPVVVLMPGLGPSIAEYSALAEDLASHGYAVVGINPSGSSQVVGFPDGHLVYGTPQGSIAETNIDAWYATASRVVGVWVDDASFVVSTLAKNPPALGALDFSHVAYVGHSLGGNASFEVCARWVTRSEAMPRSRSARVTRDVAPRSIWTGLSSARSAVPA